MNAETLLKNLKDLKNTFEAEEQNLTNLDRAIGDGDHGVNMLRGFKAVDEKVTGETISDVLKSTGMTLMSSVGGASGPLYGFSFVKMAGLDHDEMTQDNLIEYINTFKEAIATRGKVTGGEKTMYDVLLKSSEHLDNGNKLTEENLQQFAEDTKDLEATKGRASYFKKDSIGHMDPGAQSMVYVLKALSKDV
ncbi:MULTISPECIES: dihydroxyacetone kinase subunit DhaL [Mammaliicoccus]|uniref:Dihydroxyacetone kinase subunit L n=1 Tax=Mammaliicoccus fleurettii TaxID=150056 RepID=A0ABS5MQP5_9STAP|nr:MULTISPECIES: dihydroxyacetone kinase subunit DhaL [Mammaliicoccus]HCN61659.1 dihydroxyacetone kinase subunit L [Staphylococcus sp.]MBL0848385.1 dihydroxyacetone kinase subunit L [Mammaliicoccus fleurettii]MBO3061852.1 dihydroxyacetone kinase subunit L [Mammaliicoccus fleurettii]MBS3673147.1 dihydroxyacetone kinase subunit L [Mammaliicoccus fleurettii]MBS3698202.1 dihydroxyacetone kinase subunit L [Mammaliicoccus fleurettii]